MALIALLVVLLTVATNMKKTILLTGATDGIGFETAKLLIEKGHSVLLHGRNPTKLQTVVEQTLGSSSNPGGDQVVESYVADLSKLSDVESLAQAIREKHSSLDVIINNAGVLKATSESAITSDGLDVRFQVNTIAPYLLTQRLLPLMRPYGRIVNVSSAAQAPVNLAALRGKVRLPSDMDAYAQSKLAIIMWTNVMAEAGREETNPNNVMLVSVNPASMLGTKMVKEGFGVPQGKDIGIGADILVRAALSKEFQHASGKYYDNDSRRFTRPHPDALNAQKCHEVVSTIDMILSNAK